MNKIEYKITFFSLWHCGSGSGSGSECDAIVIKDAYQYPFIPGKTLKGLLREAAEVLYSDQMETVSLLFGKGVIKSDTTSNRESQTKGSLFFSNAILHHSITANHSPFALYRHQSFTAINKDEGVKKGSLRKIEFVVPCSLYASIENLSPEHIEMVTTLLLYVKRLGLQRHRGMGRCKFEMINTK